MDLKEQLLAATVRVISEQGWRGATTRRIAEAAGVNEVTLFRHFGSKETLIRDAMCWQAERAPVPTLPEDFSDARAELTRWAEQHYRHLLEMRAHIRQTIGQLESDPEVMSWTRKVPRRMHDMLERYAEGLRRQGRATGDWDPSAAASLLLGALFADAISRDVVPQHVPQPLEDAPRQYVELFLRAIGYIE